VDKCAKNSIWEARQEKKLKEIITLHGGGITVLEGEKYTWAIQPRDIKEAVGSVDGTNNSSFVKQSVTQKTGSREKVPTSAETSRGEIKSLSEVGEKKPKQNNLEGQQTQTTYKTPHYDDISFWMPASEH